MHYCGLSGPEQGAEGRPVSAGHTYLPQPVQLSQPVRSGHIVSGGCVQGPAGALLQLCSQLQLCWGQICSCRGTRPTVPTRRGGSCRHFVELLLGEVAATKMVGVSGTFISPQRALGLAGLLQKQVILLEREPGGAVWWGGLGRVSGAGTDTKFGGFQCQCLKHFVLSLAVVFSKIFYLCINCCQKRETGFIN